MSLPSYRYSGEPDADERGGPSDSDYDNGPRLLPDQSFMPDNPNSRPLPNPNVGDDQAQQQWLEENVFSKGWTVDAATNEIYDPQTDTVKGTMPTFYPRV